MRQGQGEMCQSVLPQAADRWKLERRGGGEEVAEATVQQDRGLRSLDGSQTSSP